MPYCVFSNHQGVDDPSTGVRSPKVLRVFDDYDTAADLFRRLEEADGWRVYGMCEDTRFDLADYDPDTGRPGRLCSYVFDDVTRGTIPGEYVHTL